MENTLLNFSVNNSEQWELVALIQKLDVSTTIFGGGSTNCCSSLLIEGFAAVGILELKT